MKKYSIIILALIFASASFAQRVNWSASYSTAVPYGDTKDFTNNFSWLGFSIDGQKYLTDDSPIAFGVNMGWNTFHETIENATYKYDNITVYGDQYRYTNVMPLYLHVNYDLMQDNEAITPFIKFGVGTIWSEELLQIGTREIYDQEWKFALSPEIGALIPINESLAYRMSFKYNVGFPNQSTDNYTSYLSFNIGLTW